MYSFPLSLYPDFRTLPHCTLLPFLLFPSLLFLLLLHLFTVPPSLSLAIPPSHRTPDSHTGNEQRGQSHGSFIGNYDGPPGHALNPPSIIYFFCVVCFISFFFLAFLIYAQSIIFVVSELRFSFFSFVLLIRLVDRDFVCHCVSPAKEVRPFTYS